MSTFGQMHNDYLDPDRHLWPAEDFSNELSALLEAMAGWDTGRWDYAPVSKGKGICLTGKDGDLERGGQQGIELVAADEDHVYWRVHAGATFAGLDVCLNLRPKDEENEAVAYAYREAYLDQAGEVMAGIPFPGYWSGDDWYISLQGEVMRVEWHYDTRECDSIDYEATATELIKAAHEALKDWERENDLAHDALDVLAGWTDKDNPHLPPKTDNDPALPLLPLDEQGEPIVPDDEQDEPPDQFRDDVEADADALASAGYGTDEDYGYFGDDQ